MYGKMFRVWRDLPMLADCMKTCFNGPSSMMRDRSSKYAQMWRELNSFGARCLGASVQSPYEQSMSALRSGLEEELSTIEEGLEPTTDHDTRKGEEVNKSTDSVYVDSLRR
ncbi:uncharacterized protein LY89DRAFT_273750 [Mollisia scopiformis]|uniref:Uncharacterized protein n=1 Tax=Mollisia scopiformis TaxID=149040 RepID=A0A132BBE4_MOLSC|nr:uncharacterized protein LY89DRAFT_273750 [Mollisia scopiformis]KUJ09593.1 hypothetical protein LY89DRAFT_273750 [Mollisia scopiformis]